ELLNTSATLEWLNELIASLVLVKFHRTKYTEHYRDPNLIQGMTSKIRFVCMYLMNSGYEIEGGWNGREFEEYCSEFHQGSLKTFLKNKVVKWARVRSPVGAVFLGDKCQENFKAQTVPEIMWLSSSSVSLSSSSFTGVESNGKLPHLQFPMKDLPSGRITMGGWDGVFFLNKSVKFISHIIIQFVCLANGMLYVKPYVFTLTPTRTPFYPIPAFGHQRIIAFPATYHVTCSLETEVLGRQIFSLFDAQRNLYSGFLRPEISIDNGRVIPNLLNCPDFDPMESLELIRTCLIFNTSHLSQSEIPAYAFYVLHRTEESMMPPMVMLQIVTLNCMLSFISSRFKLLSQFHLYFLTSNSPRLLAPQPLCECVPHMSTFKATTLPFASFCVSHVCLPFVLYDFVFPYLVATLKCIWILYTKFWIGE
ncbi:hypothetical protein L9F63_011828, partial [Diploptera punctata]